MALTKIKINDEFHTADLQNLPPDITLNTFIREHAQLTATKFMCLEGGCGVCVVTIKGKHPATGKITIWAANSCLIFLNSCLEWEITTCEGLGNTLEGYHPIQERMATLHASQCGFCSPGIVMNMHGLLESKNYKLTMAEIENSLGGNICRCTGYRPILEALKSFASDSNILIPKDCGDIEDLLQKTCPKSGQICTGGCKGDLDDLSYSDGVRWYWPKTLNDIFGVFSKINFREEYMLVAGNTAHGVYRRSEKIKHFIDINSVAELKKYDLNSSRLCLGANVTLAECMNIFEKAARMPGFEYCQQLWQHFDLVANTPVRNMATLAGNISIKKMHKEFISDVFLTFVTVNAQVVVATTLSSWKRYSLLEYIELKTFKTLIIAFELPAIPKNTSIFKSYKIMPRAQNAHAIVNAAFLLNLNLSTGLVFGARICFGGIRPDFVHATAIEQIMLSKCFYDKAVVGKIFSVLPKLLRSNDVLPEFSSRYRSMLACGLMLKFLLKSAPPQMVRPDFISGGYMLKRNLSSGVQMYDTHEENYPVTQPVQKVEALIQCSGEAKYTNDIITAANTVYCAFVHATVVRGIIEEIIASEALSMPGVIAFYTANDIPAQNSCVDPEFGYAIEEIFTADIVRFYDQPLGMIVATTKDIALRAASKVKVIYTHNGDPIMPTVQEVLENNQLDRMHNCLISDPNPEFSLPEGPIVTGGGFFDMGLQYHFTMEPHTCVAIPFEQGLQVWASTQCIDHTQAVIARMLSIKTADVQLKVRRLGGAYGCKITGGNRVACAASLAAFKLNRPARFVETIESMMSCVGKRWSCHSDYTFDVKTNGKIVRLTNTFLEDAGCTLNQNPIEPFTKPAAYNCYDIVAGKYTLVGKAVVTDAPSSIFFRAPGSLEGIAMIENIMEHIAFETGLDPADVRQINIQPGNKMSELLPRFLITREYKQRRQEIDDFNSKNRWIKRGIGLSLMQFGCHYVGPYTATVTIYHTDGSVVISHGGIEMGQGLNTKVVQVAAYCFGISMENVKIEASDTINGANCLESGASLTSESICYAVRKACNTLNDRLEPIKSSLDKDAPWMKIVDTAKKMGVHLTASEICKVGDMDGYNIYALVLTEVKVDMLTGNLIIARVDILEDCGESLSPYVDVGQIEGAFIMCIGYWLTERLVYRRETGQLLTNRTWTYKPPGAKDIPIDFRIEMLSKSANTGGFMRSKATGEPPCCLAVSVIFAIQHAIQSARKDAGLPKKWVRLGGPTTPETIVLNSGSDVSIFALK